LSPEELDDLSAELGIIEVTVARGITTERSRSRDATFQIWSDFREQFGKDPYLCNEHNPIAWMLFYASRVRSGRLAKGGQPVRSRTVEEELLAVTTAHTLLGYKDPRHNETGKIDYRLQLLLKAYTKEDPPPQRVKPVPVPLLIKAYNIAQARGTAKSFAVADMMWLGFFFLGRPGEYTAKSEDSSPFRACDATLFMGDRPIPYATASEEYIKASDFATMEFTTQKNAVRGEVVGHRLTPCANSCPVSSIQ